MGSPDFRCAAIASEQHGCITLAQAIACGLSAEAVKRRVRTGRWERVLPRTYAFRGTPATWERQVMAATLWVGDGAAASGPSAAALWRFPDSTRGAVEISHVGAKQSRKGVVVRRVHLDAVDVTSARGIPVTSPGRTLADLAGRLSAERFDAAFHHCLHEKLTTLPALEELVERRCGAGFTGAGRLRQALTAYDGGAAAASPLESRFARRLLRSSLPPAERQHVVIVDGRRRYLDFAWPSRRVALEVDGYRWHSSRTAWTRDRKRLAGLRRAGWTVVQVTQEDADRGFDDVVAELRALLH